jgi:hypothetical protein
LSALELAFKPESDVLNENVILKIS